jgi:hypothetical protein
VGRTVNESFGKNSGSVLRRRSMELDGSDRHTGILRRKSFLFKILTAFAVFCYQLIFAWFSPRAG